MANRITTERLAELRAIAEKATPGPWRWGEHVDPTVALKEMLEAGAPLTVATLPNTGAKPGSCLFICLLLGQREEVDFDNAALIAAAPELLSALLAERAEVERYQWRPIETAPGASDDTPPGEGARLLLACTADNGFRFTAIGDYDDDAECWLDEETDGQNDRIVIYPTHWMPLPEPPTELKRREGE